MNSNDWRNAAACIEEDPELFFPKGTEGPWGLQIEQAKAICRTCPVVDSCLQFALTEDVDEGVFGGLTAKERASLNRSARRHSLPAAQVTEKAEQARQPARERTPQTLWEDNTVALFGGHLAWTGPAKVYVDGRNYTPKKLAFILDRGREPDGRVLGDCGNDECVLPAHVADDTERARCGTRAGYRRHHLNGETACDACRQANTDADNRLRRTGTTKQLAA